MIGLWGEVRQIELETSRIQRLSVWVEARETLVTAIHYPYLADHLQPGDRVLVNTSGLDLKLGTGGVAFVVASQKEYQQLRYKGRIMKLRYSAQQTPVETVECEESSQHDLFKLPFSLESRWVVAGELHSMLPVLVALVHLWQPGRRIAYLMDDQAALHLGYSDHVRRLQQRTNLTTITYGQAMGGDLEAVNLYTALEAAVKVVEADDIIITQGPGVVGTRTVRGFSGMQLAHWIHTISTCEGTPLIIPRIQWGDRRERHRGLSEHTRYPLLVHTLARAVIPYPANLSQHYHDFRLKEEHLQGQMAQLAQKHDVVPVDVQHFKEELEEALDWYGPVLTMGRSYQEEPAFFAAVGAVFHFYRLSVKMSKKS